MKTFLAVLFSIIATSALAAPYALITSDGSNVVEIREWETVPPDLGATGTPNQYWLAYEITDPPFDPVTQVRSGPVRTIEGARVADTWTVRDKTPEELANDAEAVKTGAVEALSNVSGYERAFLSVLLEELNRHSAAIQAIKDASAGASTLAQFKAAVATVQVPPARSFSDLRTAIRNKVGQ
jgi:hypothetical protein